jgi:uncharacterized protein (DUF4415 family)
LKNPKPMFELYRCVTLQTWKLIFGDRSFKMSKVPTIKNHSPERDLEIRAQILSDPDTWEAPVGAVVLKRGRPSGQNKAQVTIRIDHDVLAALQAESVKGWQTRANALLRKALAL